jgi:hypothetical protein
MKIELPYGETTITAELPAGTRLLSNVVRAGCPRWTTSTACCGRRSPPRAGGLASALEQPPLIS